MVPTPQPLREPCQEQRCPRLCFLCNCSARSCWQPPCRPPQHPKPAPSASLCASGNSPTLLPHDATPPLLRALQAHPCVGRLGRLADLLHPVQQILVRVGCHVKGQARHRGHANGEDEQAVVLPLGADGCAGKGAEERSQAEAGLSPWEGGRKGRLRGAERDDGAGSGCAGAAQRGPKGCSQPPNAPRLQLGSREMPKPSSRAHHKHAPQPCAQLRRARGLLEADTRGPPAHKPHNQHGISSVPQGTHRSGRTARPARLPAGLPGGCSHPAAGGSEAQARSGRAPRTRAPPHCPPQLTSRSGSRLLGLLISST